MRKIEDYLHLYLGCDVYDSWNEKTGKLVEIKNTGKGVGVLHQTVWYMKADEIKLLLRPLSDMTDDELQECGNMVYDFSDEPELNNHRWQDFEVLLAPEQFHWLLNKHFDLFGLIESGLAIPKASLKATT